MTKQNRITEYYRLLGEALTGPHNTPSDYAYINGQVKICKQALLLEGEKLSDIIAFCAATREIDDEQTS